MLVIAILFFLICLLQLVLIFAFRQPKTLFKTKIFSKANLYPAKVILFAVMGFLYVILFIKLGEYHQPQPLEEQNYVAAAVYPTVSPGVVTALGARKTSTILNLYYLYLGADKSEQAVTATAQSLRQENCKSLCIINLYDDKKAFATDMERVQIVSEDVMKEWNKKNYVFVADHYLGYLDAVSDAHFAYYPFHDGYYRHAKAGDLKNY